MANHPIWRIVAGRWTQHFVAVLLGLWLGMARACAAEPGTIYFYSSETSVNNYHSLKEEFDSYLAALGPYAFQPFSQTETFDSFMRDFMRDRKNAVFVLSSWHYKNLKERSTMEPVLVARRQDQTTQRRVLSADRSIVKAELLRGGKIAAAGTEEYVRNLLREILGSQQSNLVASVSILIVPKDIDALMAVSFKMAGAALTTEGSLASLAQINPRQHAQLHLLGGSRQTLLPIVVVPAHDQRPSAELLRVLEEMSGKPEGQRLLKMLGFDALQRLAPAEKELLTN